MYENPKAAKTKLTFSFHFFGGDNFRLFSPLSPPTGSRSPVLLSLAGAKGNNSSLALSKRRRGANFSQTMYGLGRTYDASQCRLEYLFHVH